MRFSIRNLAVWTTSCGLVLALAQVTGLAIALFSIAFLIALLLLYEAGLRSAGLQSDRLTRLFIDLTSVGRPTAERPHIIKFDSKFKFDSKRKRGRGEYGEF